MDNQISIPAILANKIKNNEELSEVERSQLSVTLSNGLEMIRRGTKYALRGSDAVIRSMLEKEPTHIRQLVFNLNK